MFIGICTLLLVFFLKIFTNDSAVSNLSFTHLIHKAFFKEFEIENVFDCINISVTSYGFILNFFPIYSSMRHRTNNNASLAVTLALAFVFFSYTFFSFVAFLYFGININPNIFENLKNDNGFMSVAIRILFLIIFTCNIPFAFLAGKECCLIVIMEYKHKIVTN